MVKSVVKHIFDCFFSFSEPPEIRTVERLSAVFAFVRCEHRLCSQPTRAPSCATPGFIKFLVISVSVGYYVVVADVIRTASLPIYFKIFARQSQHRFLIF